MPSQPHSQLHSGCVVAWLGMRLTLSSHVSYNVVDYQFLFQKLILISIALPIKLLKICLQYLQQYCMCYLQYCMCYLQYCMCYLQYCMCYLVLVYITPRCDQNHDGTIDYTEFTKYLTGTHTYMCMHILYMADSACVTPPPLPAHTEAHSTGAEFVSTHSATYSRSSSIQAEVRTCLSSLHTY